LSGFDPIALAVPPRPMSRRGGRTWTTSVNPRRDRHRPRRGSVLVGLHDPDGIEIRIYVD
jgi:hypothetical protein